MIRIVKLTFKPEYFQDFLSFIEPYKVKINGVKGCHGVQFLSDKSKPHIFFTYSQWDNPESLEAYRQSELFQHVWMTVKQWFDDKPEAWSLYEI